MASATQSLWDNPLGTDGFEFVEYAAPDPAALGRLFEQMGFIAIAKHRSKNVLLYRQGGVNFIVNAEPDSFAQGFARVHGPSICAMAFRVRDAALAYRRTVEQGAWGVEVRPGPMELNIPAIKGIGDSLIYLVDRYPGADGSKDGGVSIYDIDFVPFAGVDQRSEQRAHHRGTGLKDDRVTVTRTVDLDIQPATARTGDLERPHRAKLPKTLAHVHRRELVAG